MASAGNPVSTMLNQQAAQKTKWSQFAVLISVFFFWGFVAASNDILIPVFKEKLGLKQEESQYVAVAFYVAYTVGSIIYTVISYFLKGDILNKIGYKNGIALGLIISALGTLLFYPAANTASFPLMLSGLFIVGLGFSLQQTAANPLAIVMGDPKTGAQRLSMAGGINNFGTTIGPLLVSYAIFGSAVSNNSSASIEAVKTPYLVLGGVFLLAAIIFKFSNVPDQVETVKDELEAEPIGAVDRGSALKYPQLWLGMIGIFVYVGAEVTTASNLPGFMEKNLGITASQVAPYVSLYWASLMIGRWTASVGAFEISEGAKKVLSFLMPYIAFGVFLAVNSFMGYDVSPFYVYAIIIIGMIAGNLLSKGNPARQLLIYSLLAITALLIGMLADGMVSVFAFISVGLFCSTLWPCIFTLAVAGLGRHTNKGSSFLIMMIFGGGIISYLQGVVAADDLLGIKWSYLVAVACFIYLAFYAVASKSILKAQGIDYDQKAVGGGH